MKNAKTKMAVGVLAVGLILMGTCWLMPSDNSPASSKDSSKSPVAKSNASASSSASSQESNRGVGERTPELPSIPADPRLATLMGKVRSILDGAPVAEAAVLIETTNDTVLSDEQGEYGRQGLAPGVVRVSVRATGYVPLPDRLISLHSGPRKTVADFELTPAALIEGRVETIDGKGIPDAEIWLLRVSLGVPEIYQKPVVNSIMRMIDNEDSGISKMARQVLDEREDVPDQTRSDDDGRFAFDWAPVGEAFIIQAMHPGYAMGASASLVMSAGERKEVLIVLKQGASISGTVKDTQGKPVPGARAVAIDAIAVPSGNLASIAKVASLFVARQVKDAVKTDSQGGYSIRGLSAGRYRVVAEAEGMLSDISSDVQLAANETITGVDLTLSPGATISGRVANARNASLSKAYVIALSSNIQQPEYDYAQTDSSGRYRLTRLREGIGHYVVAWAEGYGWQSFHNIAPTRDGVDFKLELDAMIRGQVINAVTRKPVTRFGIRPLPSNISIEMYLLILGKLMQEGIRPFIPFQDSEGLFELDYLSAGDYRLTFSADGYLDKEVTVTDLMPDEVFADVVIEMDPGTGVTGVVLEADGEGKPIANARVTEGPSRNQWEQQLMPQPQNEAYTDEQGRFFMIGLPSNKPTTLFAAAKGYVEGKTLLTPPLAEDFEAVIRLSRSAKIIGQVVSSLDSAPIEGASIFEGQGGILAGSIRPRGMLSQMENAVQSNEEGFFELDGIAAGSHRLTVRHPDYPEKTTEYFSVTTGEPTDIGRIELGASGSIWGGVVGPNDEPIVGASLLLTVGSSNFATSTDGQGQFSFENVEAGVHQLTMTESVDIGRGGFQKKGAKQVQEVTVEAGQTVEVVFAILPGSRLHGQVLVGTQPATGQYRVNATAMEAEEGIIQEYEGETDASASYEISDIPPGVYNVILRPSGTNRLQGIKTETVQIFEPDVLHNIKLPESGVSGIVVNSEGAGVGGAVIELFGLDLPGVPRVPRTRSDNSGQFSFSSIPAGQYSLVARHSDHGYSSVDIQIDEGQVKTDARIQLESSFTLEGRSLFAHLNPPGAARPLFVRLIDESGKVAFNDRVSVEDDGKFQISSLVPGQYQLEAFTFTFALNQLKLEAAPLWIPSIEVNGQSQDLLFRPGVPIRMRIVSQGNPVGFAQVFLLRPNGEPVIFPGKDGMQSNPEGLCRLEHVALEPHRVAVHKEGYLSKIFDLTPTPAMTDEILVELEPLMPEN